MNGCIWLFVILFGIALLITYWYVFLAVAVLGGALGYYVHQKHKQAAEAEAKQNAKRAEEERQQEVEDSKVDQIRRFKELFDEGAITQAEFDQQKQRILEDKHDHDDLEF
jgi:predicted membrane protein